MANQFDTILYDRKLNEIVQEWGRGTRIHFLRRLRFLPFKERVMAYRQIGQLLRGNIALKYQRQSGNIVRVSFPFTRHGIFQEHGVGRGRKKGSSKVKPMPWIEPTLKTQMPLLRDAVYRENMQHLGLIIKIKVNGIFEMSIDTK